MTSLVPSFGSNEILPAREGRAAGRQLARMGMGTEIRKRRIELEADASATKLREHTYLANDALASVAGIAQREDQLMQAVPHAAGRLRVIAEEHTFKVLDVMREADHRLRRL